MVLSVRFPVLALLFLFFSGQVLPSALGLNFGINYGQIANNLPPPSQVAILLQSLNISKVKLYDADPNVLSAFANSSVEFIIAVDNGILSEMTDSTKAQTWLEQNVQPHLSQTLITTITVGNEIFSGNDTTLISNLLPAMQGVYQALVNLGLDKKVNVTTAHSLNILATSFPPSSATFRQDIAGNIQQLLNFQSQIKSPFLINAYPYFAYEGNSGSISLEYVLFEPNPGVIDPNSNLTYDNMLYAQIDSVYCAIEALGHTDIDVRISETGWPSKGDPDEIGATPENAALYNGNLLKRIEMNQGTPLKPSVPLDIFVFALFNEDLKPGPTSERNYGLFYPDATPVYNLGLPGNLSSKYYSSASSKSTVISGLGLLILVIANML